MIAFGTLFNNIEITRDGGEIIKIPLAYGPTQKFLARLEQQPDLNKPVQISLPRISFEFTGVSYDSSRKLASTQHFATSLSTDSKEIRKMYHPVPYNMDFELSIMTLLNDDALQIVEQILPFFQPAYNVSVELVQGLQEKRDIPVVLENITMQDDYEGDFSSRRVLLYTLRFTAKTYLFGPASAATKDIIKKATVSYLTGTDLTNATREKTYSVEPRAIKNYTGDAATTLAEDITRAKTSFNVVDASGLTENTYVDLNGEEIFITKITSNKINVKRGQDGTTITDHVAGEEIFIIDAADTALIETGDDFGFDGGF